MFYKSKTKSGGRTPKWDDQAQKWNERLKSADTYYRDWAQRFDCETLENYYEGYQWKDQDNKQYKPYTINLIFSTIEVKSPSLLFTNPVFNVAPKPWKTDFNPEESYDKALLKQDTLNSIIQDNRMHFAEEVESSILDAWFRFGMIEVGYSANWIDNPNAGKPILRSDNEPYVDSNNGETIKEPSKLPVDERIFARSIPASTFRVGGIDTYRLDQCNWFGYYEWVRVADLKANPNLSNLEWLEMADRSADFTPSTGNSQSSPYNENLPEFAGLANRGDLIKVWKIWETRWRQHYIYAENQRLILRKNEWNRIPLFPLVFHKRSRKRGFYPIPPVWPWLPPQNEINESREMNRVHRRRFVRKYLVRDGVFTNEGEFDKLLAGGDGAFATVNVAPGDAVAALPTAELGASEQQATIVSKDDFNIVSGTTAEERGQADRTTATQANLTNNRAQIRESKPRIIVANWLCEIGREILLTAAERFTDPIWIKRFFDAESTIGMEMPKLMFEWKQIQAEDLDGEDFDVGIQVDSLSPVTNDEEQKKFLTILALLNQYPQLSMSPTVLNELFDKFQYRNMKVRAELLKMATLHMIGMMAMLQKGAQGAMGTPTAGAPGNLGQNTVANATPPTLDTLNQQLSTVGGGGQ